MNQATSIDAKFTIEWLNKLVMLGQWDKKLPFHVVHLVSDATAYSEFRSRVASGALEQTESTEKGTPIIIARNKLMAAVSAVPALREMFAAEVDPFKDAPPDHLQLLAEVSDITVKPPQMIYSRNGTLIAVVEALRQSQQLNAESLIVDGLNKFFTLIETRESVAKMLFELAKSPHWYVVLAALREGRDYTGEEDPTVGKIIGDWQGKLTTSLRELLFRPGHLSRAPKKLIEMAWTDRKVFDEARNAIPADARKKDDEIEERRQVTNEALALFAVRAKPVYDGIKADLNVLATVARHYINVRKFAKLDGFVYTWPDIARLAMSNYPALKYVEDLLVNRKPLPTDADPDAQDLYKLCEKNDRLIRFFRLRPYFSEINENELRSYQPLAPVVVTETPPTDVRSANFPTPQPQPLPPQPVVKPLTVLYLTIAPDEDAPVAQQGRRYNVTLVNPQTAVYLVSSTVTFSVEKLLERILGAMGVTSDAPVYEVLRELFASAPAMAESRIARGGNVLAKQVLPTTNALSGPDRLRLVINCFGDMQYLPWEWLTVDPPSTSILLGSPDYSMVRANSSDADITPVTLYSPVRILSIFPDPPSGERPTPELTVKGLEGVVRTEGAHYKALIQSEATLGNVQDALKTFSPHIVHFEGSLSSIAPEGVVRPVFSKSDLPPITVEQFGDLLKEKSVQLLVIGKNSHGRIYDNTVAAAAYLLSRKGLPAIIAPMRAIDDQSAMLFSAEFYTAFLRGNPLEASLHIARRALAKSGDWSVFALFADPSRLDDFQVFRETA